MSANNQKEHCQTTAENAINKNGESREWDTMRQQEPVRYGLSPDIREYRPRIDRARDTNVARET